MRLPSWQSLRSVQPGTELFSTTVREPGSSQSGQRKAGTVRPAESTRPLRLISVPGVTPRKDSPPMQPLPNHVLHFPMLTFPCSPSISLAGHWTPEPCLENPEGGALAQCRHPVMRLSEQPPTVDTSVAVDRPPRNARCVSPCARRSSPADALPPPARSSSPAAA